MTLLVVKSIKVDCICSQRSNKSLFVVRVLLETQRDYFQFDSIFYFQMKLNLANLISPSKCFHSNLTCLFDLPNEIFTFI